MLRTILFVLIIILTEYLAMLTVETLLTLLALLATLVDLSIGRGLKQSVSVCVYVCLLPCILEKYFVLLLHECSDRKQCICYVSQIFSIVMEKFYSYQNLSWISFFYHLPI